MTRAGPAVYDFVTHDLFGNLLSGLLLAAGGLTVRKARDAVATRRRRRRP